MGVVYGDIGTSPLYAFRESLRDLPLNPLNILGVMSLIFWTLILVICIYYLGIILRADNDGEGGVLALYALIKRGLQKRSHRFLYVIGIAGAGLLLGDAMITPAISVVSAIEGLDVISPTISHLVLPITVTILCMLFLFQRYGSQKIGFLFGPVMLIWFSVIGLLGAIPILDNPSVLKAINPYYALNFLLTNGWTGYILLGGVFLVVTGTEALYADLGHFGRKAIRIGWYTCALPGILLNYFGQAAILLAHPGAIKNPFYALSLAPLWFSLFVLILSTTATIVASQAVISATFSVAKQAVLLNLYPRLAIKQTSKSERGQVYVPQMNKILMIGTLLLIMIFRTSSSLANAYGVAVNLVMFATTIMVIRVAKTQWRWSVLKILFIIGPFFLIDLSFLGANAHKVLEGGWFPLVVALGCTTVMITWNKGVKLIRSSFYMDKTSIDDFIHNIDRSNLYLPDTTAIFITDPYDQSGGSFLHYLKLNRIIPKQLLIVSIQIENHPEVKLRDRFEVRQVIDGIHSLVVHYGFMQLINIPRALKAANRRNILPFIIDVDRAAFHVEMIHLAITRRRDSPLYHWQKRLFALLMRNALIEIEFFHLPYNRTVAIGTYCAI